MIFSILRDTGLRPIELHRLILRNIDLEHGIIYPETAKHGSPRVLKLKNSTLNMLNNYLAKKNTGLNEHIFGKWNSDNYGKSFRYYRNLTAKKLQEPQIRTIKLYHLRHYFATMLLKKTNNLVLVQQKLGHRDIRKTLVYAQIVDVLEDDNYSCEIAERLSSFSLTGLWESC